MGFLDRFFGGSRSAENVKDKQFEKNDFSVILEIAELISSNNKAVSDRLKFCVERPEEYFSECSERYTERGIDVNNREKNTLYWIGMVDELAEQGFLFSVDWNCELEDFLWAMEQIKTYPLISDEISSITFDENCDILEWGRRVNEAVGKARLCWVDIDSDSYELIIVTTEALEKIASLAPKTGYSVKAF